MSPAGIDILMITHNRPEYTELALDALLESCDEQMRVWLWHNGDDAQTLEVVRRRADHPNVFRFHVSPENVRLTEPTNWLWAHAKGELLSKVDDDCILPRDWAATLRRAHDDCPELGVVGCWRFPEEDFLPEIAEQKIRVISGGHRIMQNCWIEGSGYLMKRQCVEEAGLLHPRQSFTDYCIELADRGWIHGWYYPFIHQEHMDDPRAPHTLLKTDEDLRRGLPLSAAANGIYTLFDWEAQLKRSARLAQEAPVDPGFYRGWRRWVRNLGFRVRSLLGDKRQW